MGVDIIKKLKGEAQARQQQRQGGKVTNPSRIFEPAHKIFVSSNWKSLLDRKPLIAPKAAAAAAAVVAPLGDGGVMPNVVALDCEMVGVGPSGTRSALARVSIVDHEGNVLLDRFVRPNETVTDYRTHITGITAETMQKKGVLREDTARKMTSELLDDKIVVGHALQNDFQALLLSHPHALIRDTAVFKPLRVPGWEKKTPSLARLSEHWLQQKLHEGEHDSVEDARAALRLYRLRSRQWEKQLKSVMGNYRVGSSNNASAADDGVEDDAGEPVERKPAASAGSSGSGASATAAAAQQAARAAAAAAAASRTPNAGKKKRKRQAALDEVASTAATKAAVAAAAEAAAAAPVASKSSAEVGSGSSQRRNKKRPRELPKQAPGAEAQKASGTPVRAGKRKKGVSAAA
mmetsp:Transcript_49065/g.124512  ORF Transcript_49065/g.124512 Transcript_49065/m.124512 type:complete len:405 (+) Transcript_49065:60-1274(+)